jgi:dolichol-phosphate mannosyltransferase
MKLSIIVPCYNEVENVTKLSNELLPVVEGLLIHGGNESPDKFHSVEMIFVDDGSRDGTYSRLNECFRNNNTGVSFKFLKHETNLGLGAAIRTGFLNADGDILVTVDSDGTYKFSEIPSLLSLLTPEVDIVTASPYHPQGAVVGVPAYRLFLSRGSSIIYRILVDWNIYTYTCLFRAYRSEVIQKIHFKSDGFLAGTEILVMEYRKPKSLRRSFPI